MSGPRPTHDAALTPEALDAAFAAIEKQGSTPRHNCRFDGHVLQWNPIGFAWCIYCHVSEADSERPVVAALQVAERARYLLGVIDTQRIGNTSEAWQVGVERLRDSVAAVDRVYPRGARDREREAIDRLMGVTDLPVLRRPFYALAAWMQRRRNRRRSA